MITLQEIQEYADQVAREFKPERIILFGSYAYGTPNEHSDVDLLIIMSGVEDVIKKATEISIKVFSKRLFPLDLLVRTPEYIKQRIEWNDFFVKEIIEKGKVLYESSRAGVAKLSRR
jgi:uncharacterized protein